MSQYYDVVAISSGDGLEEALLEQGVRGYRIDMTRQITPLKDYSLYSAYKGFT